MGAQLSTTRASTSRPRCRCRSREQCTRVRCRMREASAANSLRTAPRAPLPRRAHARAPDVARMRFEVDLPGGSTVGRVQPDGQRRARSLQHRCKARQSGSLRGCRPGGATTEAASRSDRRVGEGPYPCQARSSSLCSVGSVSSCSSDGLGGAGRRRRGGVSCSPLRFSVTRSSAGSSRLLISGSTDYPASCPALPAARSASRASAT